MSQEMPDTWYTHEQPHKRCPTGSTVLPSLKAQFTDRFCGRCPEPTQAAAAAPSSTA